MADNKLSKLLETQISLTEWLERIGHKDAKTLRHEDNIKRQRLGQIAEVIDLPFDKPTTFPAEDVAEPTDEFKKFLRTRGEELCALRLIPKKGVHAEKIRNRGKSIKGAVAWFKTLNIDPKKYNADFVPHIEDYSWATIFVINEQGIFGEVYKGGHHILTQGLYEGAAPITFEYRFDKKDWQTYPKNTEAQKYLKEMTNHIYVPDKKKQATLNKKVGAEFTHDFIKGYFETTHSKKAGTWFIDYNRLLGKRYEDFEHQTKKGSGGDVVTGRTACKGRARGVATVVNGPIDEENFPEGGILVCSMTTPDYIPLMIKAAGVVTDKGGILCHAAIVAREMNKPCVVGTENATTKLKTGDEVDLDATSGMIRKLTS